MFGQILVSGFLTFIPIQLLLCDHFLYSLDFLPELPSWGSSATIFRHGILTGWFSMPRGFYAFGLAWVFQQGMPANWLKSATKWPQPRYQTLWRAHTTILAQICTLLHLTYCQIYLCKKGLCVAETLQLSDIAHLVEPKYSKLLEICSKVNQDSI